MASCRRSMALGIGSSSSANDWAAGIGAAAGAAACAVVIETSAPTAPAIAREVLSIVLVLSHAQLGLARWVLESQWVTQSRQAAVSWARCGVRQAASAAAVVTVGQ